jgi:hypothetical protein
MVGFLKSKGGHLSNAEWNRLMYWYIHSFLWGRYSGATESKLAQDLNAISNGEGVDGLIRLLRLIRGDLTIRADDFLGWSTGARFYPLLYLLTRVNHARDWGTGLELSNALLGRDSALQVHHIFPKSLLYRHGYTKTVVNALGNYAFLTSDTNGEISNKNPRDYIPRYITATPGAVESHWMPTESHLLEVENYEAFLERRRELLAESTNKFLDSLLADSVGQVEIQDFASRSTAETTQYASEDGELGEINRWMVERGLPEGVMNFQLTDDDGNHLATIDLAWPEGVQQELSEPLAIMIADSTEDEETVNQRGYRFFTSAADFKEHIEANYAIV